MRLARKLMLAVVLSILFVDLARDDSAVRDDANARARVMQAVGGNETLAAKLLGFDRKTLYNKLDKRGD